MKTTGEFIKWMRDYFVDTEISDGSAKRIEVAIDSIIQHQVKLAVPTVRVVRKIVLVNGPAFVRKNRKELAEEKHGDIPTLDNIAAKVCDKMGIEIAQLKYNSPRSAYHKGRRKGTEYVHARAVFATLAKEYNYYTLMDIARYLGYREHSAVIHLVNDVFKEVDKGEEVIRETSTVSASSSVSPFRESLSYSMTA